jgi:hypothetical protein
MTDVPRSGRALRLDTLADDSDSVVADPELTVRVLPGDVSDARVAVVVDGDDVAVAMGDGELVPALVPGFVRTDARPRLAFPPN